MDLQRKTDLRVIKTREAIRKAFRDMICEMEADKITVKELTDRARIHRKTFYLHYTCIEALFEDMFKEGAESYFKEIDKLPIPFTIVDLNEVFFTSLAKQDFFMERIICSQSYRPFCNKMFASAVQHNRKRYNPYAHLSKEKQDIINYFLATSSLEFYRQWVAGGKVMPLEELMELAGNLLNLGVSSITGDVNHGEKS